MFFLLVFVSHFHSVINSEQEQNSTSLQTENLLTSCLFKTVKIGWWGWCSLWDLLAASLGPNKFTRTSNSQN